MTDDLAEIRRQLDRVEEKIDSNQAPSPWLTIEQSATYLQIGLTKMRELVDSGKIHTTNIDPDSSRRSIRIHRRTLDRFLLFHDKKRLNKYERELLDELQVV